MDRDSAKQLLECWIDCPYAFNLSFVIAKKVDVIGILLRLPKQRYSVKARQLKGVK